MDETEYVYPEVAEAPVTPVQELIALAHAHNEIVDKKMKSLLLAAASLIVEDMAGVTVRPTPAPGTLTLQ